MLVLALGMLLVGMSEIETVAGGFGIAVRDATEPLHRRLSLQRAGILGSTGPPDEVRNQTDDGTAGFAPIGQGHTGFPPRLHQLETSQHRCRARRYDELLTESIHQGTLGSRSSASPK